MRIAVTGANGFVGQALVKRLVTDNHEVSAAVRRKISLPVPVHIVGDIDASTNWQQALEGVDCVVHLAARVHHLRDASEDPLASYRRTNTEGTARLARAAAEAGVRRMVFLSTAKVLGESSPKEGFNDTSRPAPSDPYAVSKWEAEQLLLEIAETTGLEVCILRPPLVYGPGVGANFLRLMRWVDRGYPLPFGAVRNRRSLVALPNLVDAIALCTVHPAAAGQTFLVADEPSLSTAELVLALAKHLQKPARLLNVPPTGLRLLGRATGRMAEIDRLLGDFAVDADGIRHTLGWQPVCTFDQALAETVAWYRRRDEAE